MHAPVHALGADGAGRGHRASRAALAGAAFTRWGDIDCHGNDLTARNEFHNGKAQKKAR